MAEEDLVELSSGNRHETENGERVNGTGKFYLDKLGRFIDGTDFLGPALRGDGG
jgi:hypothetical protein